MGQLKEDWTQENFGAYFINIHCRGCNIDVGYFDDVNVMNRAWIIAESDMYNVQRIDQTIECRLCKMIMAIQSVQPNEVQIIRRNVILKHFNV